MPSERCPTCGSKTTNEEGCVNAWHDSCPWCGSKERRYWTFPCDAKKHAWHVATSPAPLPREIEEALYRLVMEERHDLNDCRNNHKSPCASEYLTALVAAIQAAIDEAWRKGAQYRQHELEGFAHD